MELHALPTVTPVLPISVFLAHAHILPSQVLAMTACGVTALTLVVVGLALFT